LDNAAPIIFVIGWFLVGLIVFIYTTSINNWLFDNSARFLKKYGDIPNEETQRKASFWVLKLFSALMMLSAILAMIFMFA
jgi:hypothetical protein